MSTPRPIGEARRHKSAYQLVCAAGVVAFLLQLAAFRPFLQDYFPSDDDLALEVASSNIGAELHPGEWLTQGWHSYLNAYPEWTSPSNDVMRPVGNAIYWLHHECCGTHWASRLIAGYLVHAIVVAIAGYIALVLLDLSMSTAGAVMLIAFLSPAFWSTSYTPYAFGDLIHLSFAQLDMYAALFMLIAFAAFLRRRFAFFAVAATIAAFTNETALTVPIAALALPGLWKDERRATAAFNLGCLLLPVVLYAAARFWLFQPAGPLFPIALDSPLKALMEAVKRAVYWPTTLFGMSIADVNQAWRAHHLLSVAKAAIALAVNFAWWIALGFALAWALAAHRRKPGYPARCAMAAVVVASLSLGCFLLAQSKDPRHMYFFFALGPAAVFAALGSRRLGGVAIWALTLSIVVIEGGQAALSLSPSSVADYRIIKHSASQLVGLLKTLPPDTQRVYLVDDMVNLNDSPQFLQRLAGLQGQVIIINSVLPAPSCESPGLPARSYHLVNSGEHMTFHYAAANCLVPPWQAIPVDKIDAQGKLARGPFLSYEFPERSAVDSTSTPAKLGRDWQVVADDPVCRTQTACSWIGLDNITQQYAVIRATELN